MKDVLPLILTIAGFGASLFAWGVGRDFHFGMIVRRHGNMIGLGWSRWAKWGWKAEDRRLRRRK